MGGRGVSNRTKINDTYRKRVEIRIMVKSKQNRRQRYIQFGENSPIKAVK